MSAFGGKADITDVRLNVRFRPKADITQHARTPQCTGHSSEVADVAASSGMSQEPSFAIHTVFIRVFGLLFAPNWTSRSSEIDNGLDELGGGGDSALQGTA